MVNIPVSKGLIGVVNLQKNEILTGEFVDVHGVRIQHMEGMKSESVGELAATWEGQGGLKKRKKS